VEDTAIEVRLRERVRLDVFLTRRLAQVSRSRIQRHIAAGAVLVDGRRVRPSHVLCGGETITLPSGASRRLEAVAQALDLVVVHEDDDLIVVDKPAGLVVHPVGGEFERTLIGAVHRRMEARGEDPHELGIVHRLDRATSGLLVLAKRLAARRALSRAVEARRVHRAYLAVAMGAPDAARGTIDLHVRRDPVRPTRMQALDRAAVAALRTAVQRSHVSASGYSDPRLDLRPRRARTRYALLRRLPGASLLRLQLDTGRTHQIRVHLQAIGLPLLGDPIYGPNRAALAPALGAAHAALGRPALHAAVLAFDHPGTGRPLRFHAPLPADLRELLRSVVAPPRGHTGA
jgi:23S rRNA pseudouridine1911/1915/1917 synthase